MSVSSSAVAMAAVLAVGAPMIEGCGSQSSSTTSATRRDAIEAELLAADRAFARATADRGADGWADVFADSGIMFPPNGIVQGRKRIREAMRTAFGPGRPALRWEPQRTVTAAASPGFAQPDAPTLPVEQLAHRVWVIGTTAGSNVLAVSGTNGTLLIDAGPADGAEALAGALDSLGIGPVRYVVNTHYHDDHIGGNAYFRERGAVAIAHPATRTQAQIDTVIADFNDWHREAAPPEALPTIMASAALTLHLGSDTAHVIPFPDAHTTGDVIVRVEPAGVVHTGDIYEVGAYPFIDVWAGGSIAGMLEATDRLLADGGPGTRYVPGHGDVGGRAALERYRSMLGSVCAAVARERAAGADLRSVMDARTTAGFDDGEWGPARHGRVLAALVFWSLERGSGCGA